MDIITEMYIFIGLYIMLGFLCVYFAFKTIKLQEILKYNKQISYKLNEITSLEELNDTQLHLRKNLLMVFANGDIQKFKQLDKEYDIQKTKKLFYKHLEPIE